MPRPGAGYRSWLIGLPNRLVIVVVTAVALPCVAALEFVARGASSRPGASGQVLQAIAALCAALIGALAVRHVTARRTRRERLKAEARSAAFHAERLATLSRLVSTTNGDGEHLDDLLAEGCFNIHEGSSFHGIIARVEGSTLVVVAAHATSSAGIHHLPAIGSRLRSAENLLGDVHRARRTRSWRDVGRERLGTLRLRRRQTAWGAFIGTPFRVGAARCVLGFASVAPAANAFHPLDHAYLETLASICALRLYAMEQRRLLDRAVEYDALTGALNRSTFRERVGAALAREASGALIVVDIDRFRAVNERQGPQAGDALLAEVGAALCRRARPHEMVSRLGDDRFAIFSPELTRGGTADRAASYMHAFDSPFLTHAGDARAEGLTASIGVATAPEDATEFEQLIVRAEAAVFVAKDAGGARTAFFDEHAEERFVSFARMNAELADALVRHEFMLYFQPYVDLATDRVAGVEALLRWNHPVRGVVGPDTFLPFAEEHGMIGAIGEWVLQEAVRYAKAWRAEHPLLRVWFNLSASELTDPSLITRLDALRSELPGMGVEITETVAMRDIVASTRAIAAIRAVGLHVALDDFGTGYSSLAQLKRLPIDVVKVDRSFTSGLPGDAHDAAIVEAVVGLATCYGFETVAEGAETAAQIAWLKHAGCTYAQGYAYARPMPGDELDGWLRQRAGAAA